LSIEIPIVDLDDLSPYDEIAVQDTDEERILVLDIKREVDIVSDAIIRDGVLSFIADDIKYTISMKVIESIDLEEYARDGAAILMVKNRVSDILFQEAEGPYAYIDID